MNKSRSGLNMHSVLLWTGMTAICLTLTACDDAGNFSSESLFGNENTASSGSAATDASAEFTEEDVEAPEVFSATEAGLWDGRPSLGGVWVAHPDAKDPERVRIRNEANGQFVVGALFRREREVPGPRLQLSSDAAQAIGVIAGAPVELSVVALRKEQKPVAPPEVSSPEAATVDAPAEIQESTLDPIAAAGAAIESAPPTQVESNTIATAAAGAEVATVDASAAEEVSRLKKPFVQVASFSVEENAVQVDKQMQSLGLSSTIKSEGTDDQTLYRVVVGPSMSWNERRKLIQQIKKEGYSDAFAVAN